MDLTKKLGDKIFFVIEIFLSETEFTQLLV